MCAVTGPASIDEALRMLQLSAGFLADVDAASLPAAALGQCLRGMVQANAVLTVAQARSLTAFDAKDGHLADGQRTLRAWEVNVLRVTKGQAGQDLAVKSLARDHEPLLAGLREADVITAPVALQLAKWTRDIPAEFRTEAEQILVAAARRGRPAGAGADLRGDQVPHRPARPGR